MPTSDWQKIIACFSPELLEKDQVLLQEGKICKYLYFLETGLLRYYFNKDGLEITKYFTTAPYMFTAQSSFTQCIPATESIQAIEASKVWIMKREDAYRLLELPSWNTFIRKLILEVQTYTEEILTDLQTETAENRYVMLLKNEPEIIQRVPLKYLASYLGIAPQSLSRIRKKLT